MIKNKTDMSRQQKSDLMQLLSVSNIVPLLAVIVSIVIFIVKLQASTELLEYKINQLSLKLDSYVVSRENAANKMLSQTNLRNEQISALQQDMKVVKNIMKLP